MIVVLMIMSVIIASDVSVISLRMCIPGDPKKYSCLMKRKMHNKRRMYKIEIFLG